jgi:hypothetical protein
MRSIAVAVLGFALLACDLPAPKLPAHVEGERGPVVHVEYPRGGKGTMVPELERREASGEWRHVCVAPCDVAMDPKRDYRVGGPTVAESSVFHLPSSSQVDVAVAPAPRHAGFLAGIFGVLGVGALGAGGAVLLLPESDREQSEHHGPLVKGVVAGGLLAGGLLFAGIAAFIASMETRVQVAPRGN